jgi:flagellar secretion chaperone FliS
VITSGAYQAAGNAYRAQAVETASPLQLVMMLYDGALGSIAIAERALGPDRHMETAHRELTRAQDIVTELMLALDHEQGGEIAAGLAAVYDYCLDRLTTANLAKDPGPLAEVARSLASLREAWVHVGAHVSGAG